MGQDMIVALWGKNSGNYTFSTQKKGQAVLHCEAIAWVISLTLSQRSSAFSVWSISKATLSTWHLLLPCPVHTMQGMNLRSVQTNGASEPFMSKDAKSETHGPFITWNLQLPPLVRCLKSCRKQNLPTESVLGDGFKWNWSSVPDISESVGAPVSSGGALDSCSSR